MGGPEAKFVAETFTFSDENGASLSDVALLDTMVTVVDAINFLKDYDEAKYLQETGESLGEEDERSVADLLIDQIEFADVILISKTDLVKERDIEKVVPYEVTINITPQARLDGDKIVSQAKELRDNPFAMDKISLNKESC